MSKVLIVSLLLTLSSNLFAANYRLSITSPMSSSFPVCQGISYSVDKCGVACLVNEKEASPSFEESSRERGCIEVHWDNEHETTYLLKSFLRQMSWYGVSEKRLLEVVKTAPNITSALSTLKSEFTPKMCEQKKKELDAIVKSYNKYCD